MVKKNATEEACEIIFNLPSDSETSDLSDDDNDIDFSLVSILRINNLEEGILNSQKSDALQCLPDKIKNNNANASLSINCKNLCAVSDSKHLSMA